MNYLQDIIHGRVRAWEMRARLALVVSSTGYGRSWVADAMLKLWRSPKPDPLRLRPMPPAAVLVWLALEWRLEGEG